MQNQANQTTESAFMDILGDYMTGGMYSILKWIWAIFFNVNTMLLMVFLRKNMGIKIAKFSSWIFGASWLMILFICSILTAKTDPTTGMIDEATFSGPFILIHGGLFLILSLWRKIGAWWNLRRSGEKGVKPRHSYAIGESVIYPLIRRLLSPLGFIDQESKPQTAWKITQHRWIQFWEPIAVIALGGFMLHLGYGVYGKFLILAALCLFTATFRAYNNSAKLRQAQVDAKVMGKMIEPETEMTGSYVIGQ